jgi:hypothetical protein
MPSGVENAIPLLWCSRNDDYRRPWCSGAAAVENLVPVCTCAPGLNFRLKS